MKNNIIKIGSLLLLGIVLTTVISCKKSWIDPDININPNKPTDVDMKLILPPAQAGLAYAIGGDLAMASRIWMQMHSGAGNQPHLYDIYNYTQSDVNNVWNYAMYGGPMKDLKTIMDKAVATNSPHYGGVAKILMAMALGNMTDLFGDIPYSEAFKGSENLTPKFDSQESIYGVINTLLDEAIVDLSQTKSTYKPGSDDLIYGGNKTKWKKAANVLKARYALHLSKVKSSAYQDVITILTNSVGGFTSNNDDFEFHSFSSASNEQNPNFQFWDQRPGDIVMGYFLLNQMTLKNDPRISLYADGSNGYVGATAGKGNSEPADGLGDWLRLEDSPVPFISYMEQQFMLAEAYFQTSQAAQAATALNNGIIASLRKMGITDATWEAANANYDATTVTMNDIMLHKYIAMYMSIEVFNDWRRTGLPALTPASGTQIPRRYPYPTSERIYNSGNCPSATIFDRVWWDKP